MFYLDHAYQKLITTFADNAKDLDIIMPTYNLLQYGDNYSMTLGNLWNHYRNEINDDRNINDAGNYRTNNNKTTSKSFEYKTKIIWSTPDYNTRLNAELVVPLKYLSNVWTSLGLPLINCEISEISRTSKEAANPGANSPVPARETTLTTGATL